MCIHSACSTHVWEYTNDVIHADTSADVWHTHLWTTLGSFLNHRSQRAECGMDAEDEVATMLIVIVGRENA